MGGKGWFDIAGMLVLINKSEESYFFCFWLFIQRFLVSIVRMVQDFLGRLGFKKGFFVLSHQVF